MPNPMIDPVDAYRASFGRLCAGTVPDVLDAAAASGPLPASTALLDVGTGVGTLAHAATARGWPVHACDADMAMVRAARTTTPGVATVVAALPSLPYPGGSFDAVVANFVVNHVPHPRGAVRELARLVRPGGRLAVTIWPADPTPLAEVWNPMLHDADVPMPAPRRLPVDQDFARTADGLAELLAVIRARRVVVRRISWTLAVPPRALWLAVEAGLYSIGAVYRFQSADGRRRLRQAYDRHTRRLAGDGPLELAATALLGVADC